MNEWINENSHFFIFPENKSETEVFWNQRFISTMEQIKQQIARENINFVRFEATDLHGVSRSKTVPVRFFHVNLFTFFPTRPTTNLSTFNI